MCKEKSEIPPFYKVLILICATMLSHKALAQNRPNSIVSGRIADAEDSATVENVIVFFQTLLSVLHRRKMACLELKTFPQGNSN